MKKEEILQASRNENQNKDIFELEIISKGQRIGGIVALFVTFALIFVESVIIDSGVNYRYCFIIISAGVALWIYKAVKLKRMHEILLAVFFGIMTVSAGIMAVLSFIG